MEEKPTTLRKSKNQATQAASSRTKRRFTNTLIVITKELLGTRPLQPTSTIEPATLTGTTDLTGLAAHFTKLEIKRAIFHLAKGKASGPNRFPNEFFQRYWPIIKGDIIQVLNDLHDHKVDLWRINKAHISLIPKK
jgi:hypothetical protein